jgi:hypothetical protein
VKGAGTMRSCHDQKLTVITGTYCLKITKPNDAWPVRMRKCHNMLYR